MKLMNEEYIRLVINQIKNGMNEDQAFEIIKELIMNNGEKPKDIWVAMEQVPQPYWKTDHSNKCTTEYETTITILDLESIEI